MSESPAAEHLINLPAGKQGSPTQLPGKKAGIVQPGPGSHRERLHRASRVSAVGQAAATASPDKGLQVSSPPPRLQRIVLPSLASLQNHAMYGMEIPRSGSPPPLPSCACGGGSISPSSVPSRTEKSFRSPPTSILLLDFKAKFRAPFHPYSLGLQIYITSGSARGDPGPLCHCHGENASSPSTHLPWDTKGQGSQREIYGLPLLKDFSRWVSNGRFFFQVRGERRREGELGRWVRARPQVTLFFSQQAHWAEGPASSQAAMPPQAVMAAEDVSLTSPGSALSAHTRAAAEIPITAARITPWKSSLCTSGFGDF